MTADHPLPPPATSAWTSGEQRGRGDLQLYRAFVDAAPLFIALAGLDGR